MEGMSASCVFDTQHRMCGCSAKHTLQRYETKDVLYPYSQPNGQ